MTRRVLLYGDVNLNYRDGSGAWLEALAECLLRTGSEVHVLLKADVTDPTKRAELDAVEGLTIHSPFDDRVSGMAGMQPRLAASRIVELDRRHRFGVVISRGFDIAAALAVSGRFAGRLWPYLTEGPAFDFAPSDHHRALLERIGAEARRIFVQTEEARSIAESLNGSFTGKTLLMNPIVPDAAFREKGQASSDDAPLTMVYAGKFARLWNTLQMTELPDRLAAEGIETSLSMVGDKFQNTGADHDWLAAMQAAATAQDPRVAWHGGLPRTAVLDIVHRADVGLCWRDAELDSSAEISTKMLECSALGTPPVLNRTRMHEELLGADYPLFVDRGDVLATLRRAARSASLLSHARQVAQRAVRPYSMAATAERFSQYFARAEADPDSAGALLRERPHRVVLAGHDLKFASDLIESLRQRDDVELRIDKWQRLAAHDEPASLEAARWADTVICEWAGPNAVFYAKHLPASTKLIVRFHGFEIRGKWLQDLDPLRVDAFVFVSDFYRRHVLRHLGWPEERSTVIPNTIDVVDLERPKLPGSQFHLGMAGYVPFLKRPDLAVDLLETLLRSDERYHLHIRGRAPWLYQWEWGMPAGQDAYRALFQRIADDPVLRRHVIFEPFSPDMGNWFRRIGWTVSPSTRETFHLAPIEGMASGAPALVWDREGADEIFGADMVRSSTEELAELVLEHADPPVWAALGAESKQRAARYDLMQARERWVALLALGRGEAPPLHGRSLLDGDAEPQNRAEALVALRRAFEAGSASEAAAVLEAHPDWLSTEATLVAGWRRLEGWADGTSLPPAGMGPLYRPRVGVALTVGDAAELAWDGISTVPVETAESIGSFDQDVLIAVDALTRSAIRARAAAIVAAGPIGVVLAAQITARRLGIAWFAGDVTSTQASGRVGSLQRALRDRLVLDARPIDDLQQGAPATLPTRQPQRTDARRLQDLQVGLIADEFTSRTVSATVPTTLLSRTGGADQLEGLDAVIVESAWEGREHEWFHGVAYHGEAEAQDLWSLIAGCRDRGIPVMFWNKEDPVHFRSFALAASRCDHVFTTDADLLAGYLQQPNQNRSVGSLPFYAQPRLHNPLPSSREFSPTVAFAGSYYGSRYPKRSAELSMILEVAAEYGLTIYDRQKDRPDSPYQLPEALQQHSVGGVPYDEVLEVYKAHPVNINVNSVSDSPSMFSRRVVEIAASGSPVASGEGRGVREVLGESFPVLTTAAQWHDQLSLWLGDEDARLTAAWEQMRTVLRTHRADQALALMLRTAGIAVEPDHVPAYGWMIDDPALLEAAAAQSWAPVVIARDEALRAAAQSRGLEVAAEAGDLPWVTDAKGSLPDTHFEDLLLATFFVSADVLSARTDATVGAPLIDRGLGDRGSALWRSSMEGPEAGSRPYVWRMPAARA